jgi:hypothetical protein
LIATELQAFYRIARQLLGLRNLRRSHFGGYDIAVMLHQILDRSLCFAATTLDDVGLPE